ncbi:MAG TPA: FecR domain-containing protein [Caulobacteraceae bacterium]|nr:FecR domain-containing protein [Caulobacteraceae bacterium]
MAATVTDEMLEAATLWRQRKDQGEWSIDDEAELEVWLQVDERHVLAYEMVGEVHDFLDHYAASPELIGVRRDLLGRFQRQVRGRWTGKPAQPSRRAIAAILVAGVVGAGGGFALMNQGEVYRTGLGERRVVMLKDGSVLSLDAMSRVSVRYNQDERRLTLQQGQARFDVAHDASRPFSVVARNRQVIATGTAFNIDMVSPEVRVTLIEGRVLVLPRAPGLLRPEPAAGKAVELHAGQALVVKPAAAADVVKVTNLAQATAWQRGQLLFEDEPLAQAVERVNRFTERKIVVADARAAALPITGAFNAGDVKAFLESVDEFHPVQVVYGPDEVVLQSNQ